jgi:hypothetical protein
MPQDVSSTVACSPLAILVARAVAAGAPESVASDAMRATRIRFPRGASGDGRSAARVEAYFWGVIRRRALQGGAPAMTRLLVIASLERELREAGHTPEAIRRELERVHGVGSRPIVEATGVPVPALA